MRAVSFGPLRGREARWRGKPRLLPGFTTKGKEFLALPLCQPPDVDKSPVFPVASLWQQTVAVGGGGTTWAIWEYMGLAGEIVRWRAETESLAGDFALVLVGISGFIR